VSNPGSFVVAIDTSSRRASLAFARDGVLVALLGLASDAPQSTELWGNVDMLLARTQASLDEVSAFAVARGPGSFTGLRVGMTAAAGFARALGRPLYAATTLELTARAGGASPDTWAVLNAHRREVYAQRFAVGADGSVEPRSEPVVLPPAEVFERFEAAPLRVLGDGAGLYRDQLVEAAAGRGVGLEEPAVLAPLGGGWQLAPAPAFLAGELALLASGWDASGQPPVPVEPCYVRPSEAEVNLKLGRIGRPGQGGDG
jgi:tRNA threonylcarbamoyl adenosine modification protein YeaZ